MDETEKKIANDGGAIALGGDESGDGELVSVLTSKDVEYWWSNFGVIDPKNAKRIFGPKPNIMQERVFSHYRKCRAAGKPCKIMILKPRQKGASTVAEGLMYFHLRSFPNLKALLMGDVDETSDTVMDLFRTYAREDEYPWTDCPEEGQNYAPEGDQAREAVLCNQSRLKRMTAGSRNAGRSNTVQCGHWDEEAYYPQTTGRDPMLASLNCFADDQPIALGIRTTTANGPKGAFYNDWNNEDSDWEKIFAAWFEFDDSVRPFSNESEKKRFMENLREDELEELARFGDQITPEKLNWRRYTINNKCEGDVDRFRQEYPSDAMTAFHLASRPKYALGSLAEMRKAASQRHDVDRGDLIVQEGAERAAWVKNPQGGDVQICEHPKELCRYLISVDTCSGEDQQIGGRRADPDFHSVGVWRAGYIDSEAQVYRVPRLVAHHMSRVESDLLVEIIAGMCFYYGKCMVVPEVNGEAGHHVIKLLLEKRIPIFKRKADPNIMKKTMQERVEAHGWRTTTTTRKWIVDAMVKPVREKEVELSFPEIYHQYERFMVNEKGKAEAISGEHDDTVLMGCIGFSNLQLATEYNSLKRRKPNKDRIAAGFKSAV